MSESMIQMQRKLVKERELSGMLEAALERMVDLANNDGLWCNYDEVIHAEAVLEQIYKARALLQSAEAELAKTQAILAKAREQMGVEWRPVVGFEGLYAVSSNGDIRNVQTGNIAEKSLMGDGYVKADLWKKGKRKQTSAHRVVAEAFIGRIDGFEINHRNGVKTDNRVSNLEITTRSGNVNHSYYELGHIIKPILATNIATGGTTEYRSIEEAVRLGGFRSSSIYDCLNGKVKTHSGHSFSRPTAPAPAVPYGVDEEAANRIALAVYDCKNGICPEPLLYAINRILATEAHPLSVEGRDALLQSAEGRSSQSQNEVQNDNSKNQVIAR